MITVNHSIFHCFFSSAGKRTNRNERKIGNTTEKVISPDLVVANESNGTEAIFESDLIDTPGERNADSVQYNGSSNAETNESMASTSKKAKKKQRDASQTEAKARVKQRTKTRKVKNPGS